MTEDYENEEEYLGPSKSQVKREMHALQDLGKQICEMPKQQQNKLPLSPTMVEAIAEWGRIKKNEAKRRHLQYVGKVMRSEDVEAIQNALELLDPSSEAFNRILHQQEKWRDRLINDGQDALNAFCEEFEVEDMQQLRQLIRNAAKEQKLVQDKSEKASEKKAKATARKLFLHIKSYYPS